MKPATSKPGDSAATDAKPAKPSESRTTSAEATDAKSATAAVIDPKATEGEVSAAGKVEAVAGETKDVAASTTDGAKKQEPVCDVRAIVFEATDARDSASAPSIPGLDLLDRSLLDASKFRGDLCIRYRGSSLLKEGIGRSRELIIGRFKLSD